MDLLVVDNVSKIYETKKAVDGISIRVPEQSIFGLLGPNGAGKTTLIRMITKILIQDTGNITLNGVDNIERNMFIGYMPEERGLYKKMKVGEQLMYLAQLKNLTAKQAKQNIEYWFDRLDISDWWNKKVEELSKGMQQKIQFISTVMHEPKLIILDEPFSGLDPINTNLIKDEIFHLKQQGATIIFSTHRMEQVEEICEQIALINNGKIILEGQVHKLKQRFKNNQFHVQFKGVLPRLNEMVFNIIHQKDPYLTVSVNRGYGVNDVLKNLIDQGVEVHAFNEILPSLNEIFIKQVQG